MTTATHTHQIRPEQLTPRREKGKIWSHVRKKWLNETPEEAVRQEYLCVLANEYGFDLAQIDEEVLAPGERGTRGARADFLIWRTVQDRRDGKKGLIVVECKADMKEAGNFSKNPIQSLFDETKEAYAAPMLFPNTFG